MNNKCGRIGLSNSTAYHYMVRYHQNDITIREIYFREVKFSKLFMKRVFLKILATVESPNKGHFGTNINSSGLSTI